MADTPQKASFVERLDPRTKFFSVVLLGIFMFSSTAAPVLLATAAVITAGVVFSGVTLRLLTRRLRSVLWFVLIITLLNTFTLSGDVLFEVSGLYATREGLFTGFLLSSRILLLLLLSVLFVQTTTIQEMLDGIESGVRTIRRKPGRIAMTISIALHFVPMLIQAAHKIKTAQIARGADFESGFFNRVRVAFSATLPLFASAFRSAEHLALAMESRCYDPDAERTRFGDLRMHARDWLVLFALLGTFTLVMAASG